MSRRIRKRGGPFSGIIGGPIIAIFGLGMLYFGWNARANTVELIESSDVAEGIVVELDTGFSNNGGTLFYPVIEYTTSSGELVQFRSSNGASDPAVEVGEKVEVYYKLSQPLAAQEATFSNLWLLPAILLGMGGLFALFGVLGFFNSLMKILGIGGLLGIGAYLFAKERKEKKEQEKGG